MIWQIIIIISAAILIFLLGRKIPVIMKLDYPKINIPKVNMPKIVLPKIPKFTKKEKPQLEQKMVEENKPIKVRNATSFKIFNVPNKEDALFEEAEQLFRAGKVEEAEKNYLKVAAADPSNVKVYNRLGVIYMERKNYRDAKDAFMEAIRLDPKKASRHYNLAMSQVELREYRNAVESLQHALALDDNPRYKRLLKELKEKIKYRYEEMKRTED